MDPTQIAVAQLAITVAEPDANRRAAAEAVAEAAAAGARLVVLPELCDSGYVFDAADPAAEARGLAAPAADSATLRQWQALAARHRLVIVGGFCELGADGRLYNSAALVDASGTRAVYRKAHLWDNEKLPFTPGDAAPPVVDTEFGRVAVMVCYDLEFPEWTRLAALDGADLIAAPVNWPGYRWPSRGAARRGDQGAGRGGRQRGVRRGGRPVPDRARRVLDQRLAHRRPRRLPAGRAGARRPARGAHRRLRPAAGQGQAACPGTTTCWPTAVPSCTPGRRTSASRRRPRTGRRGSSRTAPATPTSRRPWPASALGRLVPRMGPHRPALRAAGRDRRGGRPDGHRGGGLAAGRAVLALGQVRLHRPPGGAAGRARAHGGLLPPRRGHAQPARRAGPRALRGQHAGRVPADPARRPAAASGDHDSRARLGEGGTAGHRGAHAAPRPRGDRDRRARPGGEPSTSSRSSRPTSGWSRPWRTT